MATPDISAFVQLLRSYDWRQDNLFYIKDKSGTIVRYSPNPVQRELIQHRHRRNIIPKARQHGITTCVALHFLNSVLTTPHQRAAIIAHRESDAYKIFEQKVRFPYEHIPKEFAQFLPRATKLTANEMQLDNGSTITADTMVRSDTLNFLHVSELGKMAAWYPIKAEEVKTGALPAAERGEIFIESTMEGNVGLMADLCATARNLAFRGVELTDKDYRFHFFGWHRNPEYTFPNFVERLPSDEEYFCDLIEHDRVVLTPEQENWYLKEREILGDKMRQEYPSTYDEAIAASTEGAFFSSDVVKLRQEQRFCRIPWDSHSAAYVALDLGFNDATSLTVFQVVGREIRIIDYHESSKVDISHYMGWLSRLPYPMHTVFLPYDGGNHSLQTGRSLADIIREDFRYKVTVLQRDVREYIQIARAKRYFPRVWIDTGCSRLMECLTFFSKEYNKRFGTWAGVSRHDEYSDGAKSFLYMVQAVERLTGSTADEYTKDEILAMRYARRY